jgi:Cu2+-exporting ATPase
VASNLTTRCAHCGLDAGPAPRRSAGKVFCCAGCEAVWSVLHEAGLGRFYDAGGVGSLAPRVASDTPTPAPHPVLDALETAGEAGLDVVGMRCASCAWLIEQYLGRRSGVLEARVSYAASTCRVRWDRDRTSLARLLADLEKIGYRARPANRRLSELQADRDGRRLLVRTGVSAFFAANVMLAAVALYAGEFQGIGADALRTLRVVSALLAAPVVLFGGWPFFAGALTALRAGRATMDTLVALGTGAAFGVSLYGLASGGPVFFDTAAMIVALLLAGRMVEHAARRRGSRAIRNLLALEPAVARLVTPDGAATVPAEDLAVGQIAEVRPGERFPADGVVVEGSSSADESVLTGEAAPRDLGPGSEVIGGGLNGWGVVKIRATRVGADTAVAGILRAVQGAMERKAPVERLADRVMAWFVPAVLAAAVLAALAWAIGGAGGTRALLVGIAVVVIACPCAVGLATPAALAVALGEAASRGIFFRSGEALERASRVRHVVFDKTGTLTVGRLAVTALRPAPGRSEDDLLALAAAAEVGSEHALGRAIVREAERRRSLPPASAFRAWAGAGVEAVVGGRSVAVGSADWLASRGVAVPETGCAAEATPVHVAVDGCYAGSIEARDQLRTDAPLAVRTLASDGIASSLFSGDRMAAVQRAAQAAGIPAGCARGALTPEAKCSEVSRLRQRAGAVAMVGDGVNDAPALAAADLGIALGTGTDVALETADVAIIAPDLTLVPAALADARRTLRIVRQNLAWAIGYNAVALPLAAAGLLHPIVAAAAMALSSVSVLANSQRLRRAA